MSYSVSYIIFILEFLGNWNAFHVREVTLISLIGTGIHSNNYVCKRESGTERFGNSGIGDAVRT